MPLPTPGPSQALHNHLSPDLTFLDLCSYPENNQAHFQGVPSDEIMGAWEQEAASKSSLETPEGRSWGRCQADAGVRAGKRVREGSICKADVIPALREFLI